jgi:2-polyprenyl-6-hydroxyphenyl methylase/3-demethylubiquinone-9 3-methyltransferase
MVDEQRARVRRLYDEMGEDNVASRQRGFLAWLAARDREAIGTLLDPRPGLTLLDAGCGAGLHARTHAAAGLRVTAVDLSPAMVDLVRPHVAEARVGDLETLALGARFDRVLCSGALDYVADVEGAFARLAGHVAPGGRLVVMGPRRAPGGHAYRLAYRMLHKIDVQLLDARALDGAARAEGLRPLGARRPFLHSVVAGWERAA